MASMTTERPSSVKAALSIDVEDWFHTDNMRGVIGRDEWEGCELRVERNTMRMLEILDAGNARATFFVLGWVAERCPDLVRTIAAAGHEVASHGYGHEHIYSLRPSEFRSDVLRSKRYLEDLTGKPVRGYRAPCFSITEWAIPILQDVGFDYDSSVVPTIAHDRYGRLSGMHAGRPIVMLRNGFYEVCVSCIRLGKRGIPWGGGGYFRLVPFPLWLQGVRTILRSGMPYIFYIHPWEIDPGQPRVPGINATNGFRQRVNLHRCEERFAALVGAFEWMPLCDLIDGWNAGRSTAQLGVHQAGGFDEHPSRADQASPRHCWRRTEEDVPMKPHLLYLGGEDHNLRIPAMLALRNHGFRVTAAGTGDPAPFVQAGIGYRRFHFNRFISPLADWAALKTISEILVEVRPDLAQSFDTKPSLLLPLAARSTPGVLVIRTINGRAFLYSSRSPVALTLRLAYRALHKMAARTAAATVFEIRDDHAFFERHGMAGKRPVVIPGAGVDVDGFERALTSGPSPAQLRRELGLGDAKVVITVTRMTRQKGIPALLDAAALVHEARPDVRFLLVGPRESEGPLAIAEAEIARHAAYVKAIGPRSDVPALLALADVFAFPTEYREGVPRVLLEAALAGVPIVTTSMPGCRDVIRDGWNGFLVPPRAPHMMAAKILNLLRDPETGRTMAGRAAERVRQEFALGTIVDRHAALYAELIDRSARSRLKNDTLEPEPWGREVCS